jgi:nicotinamidase/pyrazinamidase
MRFWQEVTMPITKPDLTLRRGDALVIADVQRDFLPGGALGVAGGDAIIGPVNRAIECFRSRGLPIVVSRDWHPRGHCSFQASGGPWPEHCVQDTPGAAFSPQLALPSESIVISKGQMPDREAYSAFEGTPLAAVLAGQRVRRLFIGGLTTDYCVRSTVLDARRLGFGVVVLDDAIRAVNASPGDGEAAIQRMRDAGARFAKAMELER